MTKDIGNICKALGASALAGVGALALVMSGGCIENDLPYPSIPQHILALAAEGESRASSD